MRVFDSVVLVPTDLLVVHVANLFHSSTIRPKTIRNDHLWVAVSFYGLLQNGKRSLLIGIS